MPQQVESKVSTVSSGISRRASAAAAAVPNAFWWQWPCRSAVRPGIAASGSAKRPASRSLATNSSKSWAWPASAVVAAPGKIAGNSSRSVKRQAGSRPMIGVPAAIAGASASSMRRASFFASSTRPAARKVRPQHSGRPTAGSGVVTR